ncbi:hypothetical protein KQH49_08785 [Mycetohabitans sp. B5]|nr:hypothetical protein [Mycetohabitans sp. B5]
MALADQWRWATQCLMAPKLAHWTTALSSDARQRIVQALSGECPNSAQTAKAGVGMEAADMVNAGAHAPPNHDVLLQMLSLSALVFFQQHPDLPVPPIDKAVTVSEQVARRWLAPQLKMPLRPAIERWLKSICPAPTWQTYIAHYSAPDQKRSGNELLTAQAPSRLGSTPPARTPAVALADQWRWATQCLMAPKLAHWTTTLSPAARQRIVHALSDGCPNSTQIAKAGVSMEAANMVNAGAHAPPDQDALLQVLPLSALVFFQQHPALPVPPIDKAVTVSEQMAQCWLAPRLVMPLRPAIERWLKSICPAPTWQAYIAHYMLVVPEPEPPVSAGRHEGTMQTMQARLQPLKACSINPAFSPEHVAQPQTDKSSQRANRRIQVQRLAHTADTPLKQSRDRDTAIQPTAIPRALDASVPWLIPDAGFAILWPLLPNLLHQLGIELRQADQVTCYQAVYSLKTLIWEDADLAPDSPLLQLLCALPPEVPSCAAHSDVRLTPEQHAKLDAWLARLPSRVPGWQRLSVTDIRTLFLQRPGTLVSTPSAWQVELQRDASDWLLMQLPWPIESVMYPWLEMPLRVNWCVPSRI